MPTLDDALVALQESQPSKLVLSRLPDDVLKHIAGLNQALAVSLSDLGRHAEGETADQYNEVAAIFARISNETLHAAA